VYQVAIRSFATGSEPGSDPAPLKAMGRFRHEAVAIDRATGVAYLTEDQDDSLIYRFLSDAPGRLQALVLVEGQAADTRNWPGGSGNMRVRKSARLITVPAAGWEPISFPK